MSLFAVIREAGAAWIAGGAFQQPSASDHTAFMDALAEQGFVLFGGPLAGSEHGRVRILLIMNADSEAEIHRRLANDPWIRAEQLITTSIEPWQILVGAKRLASAHAR